MANVLLGVTGSVAALKTPGLYGRLQSLGHAVKVVATQASLYFFDPAAIDPLDPAQPERNPAAVVLDKDEWPDHGDGRRYERGDDVLHIELRRWANLLLIAPLDANTLGKLAAGLADNCLTCVWRAWDAERPIVLAPAMNTMMWRHPATARCLRQIAQDAGAPPTPPDMRENDLVDWINAKCPHLRVAAPENRRLACGDVGIGALADLDAVARLVQSLLDAGRPR
ncbi:MAG TPA: flavoprotein [Gemmataceae bacterium]|nr:flavoprotein [Gemmataceae bacterium]